MANTFLFSDNAVTTLAAPIGTSATTLTVAAGTGVLFPNPGARQQFAITLNDALTGLAYEVCYVTAVSADTFTIVRAQEGTTAKSWVVGDNIWNGPTSGQMANFVQQSGVQLYAAASGTANALMATLSPAPTAYNAGMTVRLVAASNNTGAATLNVNGLGVQSIVNTDGTTLAANQIWAGGAFVFIYDGTNFQIQTVSGNHPGFSNIVVIAASQIWTVPNGVTRVKVRAWGGGGGGGGCSVPSGAAGGGGGGEYREGIVSVSPGSDIIITIGNGGVGGTSSLANATAGGTTSFGSQISAVGGQPGGNSAGVLAIGGAGGSGGSGGNFTPEGLSGGTAFQAGSSYFGGFSGGAFGSPGVGFTGGAGFSGFLVSTGGSGAARVNNGGSGAAGLVILEF